MAGYKDPPKEHQFKPGHAANPRGYSRGRRLADELAKLFDEKGLDRAFLLEGITRAMKGDYRYWKEIFDRLDGKTLERIAGADHGDEPATDEHGNILEP